MLVRNTNVIGRRSQSFWGDVSLPFYNVTIKMNAGNNILHACLNVKQYSVVLA